MSSRGRNSDRNETKIDINEVFVKACANGENDKVLRILDAIKDFNIDVADNLGRTALRLAIANEHLDVIIHFIFIWSINEIQKKSTFESDDDFMMEILLINLIYLLIDWRLSKHWWTKRTCQEYEMLF